MNFCKRLQILENYISLENIFFTNMNSRSLPKNKTLFGSDLLVKFFIFAQKYMSMIRTLSSEMGDIILKRRPR